MNELLEILNELRPDIDFSKENQLVSGGIFDSFDIIALTEEISDTFGVIIKPKQLTAEIQRNIITNNNPFLSV